MPRGNKRSYTDKQIRKAHHIEDSYKEPTEDAVNRAWATVNKGSGGGNKSESGRRIPDTNVSALRGGKLSHGGSKMIGAHFSDCGWTIFSNGDSNVQTKPVG